MRSFDRSVADNEEEDVQDCSDVNKALFQTVLSVRMKKW